MAITKNNFIVVYIYGNLDSESFANYYISSHEMDTTNFNPSNSSGTTGGGVYWQVDGQKVGIQTSNTLELLSESDFVINIEEPLLEALNSPELVDRNIWGIILGYKVSGGYYRDSDPSGNLSGNIISATSRIARIKHTFSETLENKLYNRQDFKRFDTNDAEFSLIVSRIDGPTLQFAKSIVDKGITLNKQILANGIFYIDPYSDKNTTGAGAYTDSLLDFSENLLPTLNIAKMTTTFQDPYIDTPIPFVENDSFVWSWFTDRATTSFFQTTNAVRVFFYNADYDGGFSIRDDRGKRWPYLALNAGYTATAGAMSDPTIAGFLNPNAFFYSLLRGSTIGEAFYFSVPHLDWTISLFGDPLSQYFFSGVEVVEEDVINEHVVWEMMSKDLAKSAAHLYKKGRELREVVDLIVDITTDTDNASIIDDNSEYPSIILLYPANDLHINNNGAVGESHLKALVNKLFDFPTFRYIGGDQSTVSPTINDYLSDNNFKVSRLLADITSESKPIEESNLLDEGWWQFEFILNDDNSIAFTNYHFTLEVFSDEDFSNLIISRDSIEVTNWTYEKEKEVFHPITSNGVTSSYIERKVRYESRVDELIGVDEYLTRGETYYFRITSYNKVTLEQYTPREYEYIIYT